MKHKTRQLLDPTGGSPQTPSPSIGSRSRDRRDVCTVVLKILRIGPGYNRSLLHDLI